MRFFIPMFLCLLLLIESKGQTATDDFASHVNPLIGSGGHGHVFVGAGVPHGAVQLGPVNIMREWDSFKGWDWCSGYNYQSTEILGFTHTHLSGTGIGDLNDLLVLPASGTVQWQPMQYGNERSGYGASFSHDDERVQPGYYSVQLHKYGVRASLTTTERAGFHQYQFTDTVNTHLLVDLGYSMGWDKPVGSFIQLVNDTTLLGYRYSAGWAADQRFYFAILFSRPVTKLILYDSTEIHHRKQLKGAGVKAALFFPTSVDHVMNIKVGVSPVSSEKALANIRAEIPGWDFNQVQRQATDKWNAALGKIKIKASDSVKTIFYTAMYHAMAFPSLFNDHDGAYRGADKKIHRRPGFVNHTVFSLWDTYRGLHPLATIIEPEKVNDYIQTLLAIYRQQGKLPLWHLQGNETNTMIGYPAVPVIVDAYLKGFRNYDVELAYAAIRHSAMQDADGIEFIKALQFIPADRVPESVAKGLEYAISDFAIAQMAAAMGKQKDADYFMKRSRLYAEYFDKSTGYMRGRLTDGAWRVPFDPFDAAHRENDYCEGNAWQYKWLVPQDVEGLIDLTGGDAAFIEQLDALFAAPHPAGINSSPDISGLIGQYAQGNEPDHHIPYLFSYAGQPWKTAEKVREIIQRFYTTAPDGLCGNDDVGEMSVWYLFAALGFYPVNPAAGFYVIGSPLVEEAEIFTGGNTFKVRVINNGGQNKYVQKAMLNGAVYNKSYLLHKDLVGGGELVLYMGDRPSMSWGVDKKDRPYSLASP